MSSCLEKTARNTLMLKTFPVWRIVSEWSWDKRLRNSLWHDVLLQLCRSGVDLQIASLQATNMRLKVPREPVNKSSKYFGEFASLFHEAKDYCHFRWVVNNSIMQVESAWTGVSTSASTPAPWQWHFRNLVGLGVFRSPVVVGQIALETLSISE